MGLVTANEIHVPSDRSIGFHLESDDVLHSFWVPQLFGKVDLVPWENEHRVVHAGHCH